MGKPQLREGLCPILQRPFATLLFKHQLPVAMPQRHDAAIIADVEEVVPSTLLHLPGQVRQLVNAVDAYLEGFVPDFVAVQKLLVYVRFAGRCQQCRKHVLVANDAVQDRACFDPAGPADEARNAPAAFPVGVLLGAMAKSNQNSKEINDLRGVIANIDDYKPAGDATVVHFAVNKYILTKDEKAKLDAMATTLGSQPRYFITVEGFTDQTGSAAINDQLSRSRADSVIAYLVGSHDVPVYRIHMVGLGSQKLVDEGKGRKAREASRRVEVTLFTAKPLTMSAAGGN
jgi:outer membrane protein OmpA-like peptidoglycan-associated protein